MSETFKIEGTDIAITFGVERKDTKNERTPTQEDFERHFKKEDIEKAKEIFTSYNVKTKKFSG
ncbi:hypothetical protein O0I16_10785 [Staphylococcus pseudintermedius]|nr:hypothetical protein [Staphylococcus pseudintermedius]MDE9985322.1 hypothetical protein [Staphylococcus pseudintermedius]MDE9987671.1 hypothetical protein [Staphylococcus pseudintermedius]MDE9999687.1 hypothetical protein [Staphylococcus pseudintermedius]MDF0029729.1 hypothetical protein [Staphylococcus pseudintermedius]